MGTSSFIDDVYGKCILGHQKGKYQLVLAPGSDNPFMVFKILKSGKKEITFFDTLQDALSYYVEEAKLTDKEIGDLLDEHPEKHNKNDGDDYMIGLREQIDKLYSKIYTTDIYSLFTELARYITKNKIELSIDDEMDLITENSSLISLIRRLISDVESKNIGSQYTTILSRIKNEQIMDLIEMYCNNNGYNLSDSERGSAYSNKYNKDLDLVKVYLNDIGTKHVLSREEEEALGKRMAAGGKDGDLARKELIEHNLRLVISIASKFVNKGLDFLDVIQNGNMGLMRATECWDYRKGYKFSTYATWWIRQSIYRGFSNSAKTIRIPVHLEADIAKMRKAASKISAETGRDATDEELIAALNIKPERLETLKKANTSTISLNETIGEEDDTPLLDFVKSDFDMDEQIDQIVAKKELEDIVSTSRLSKKEKDILFRRNGINGPQETLEGIAVDYGITRERVRQIQKKAMEKLQKHALNQQVIAERKVKARKEAEEREEKIKKNNNRNTIPSQYNKYYYGINAKTDEDRVWNNHFQYARIYFENNHNLNIPINYTVGSYNNYKIGEWLAVQYDNFDYDLLSPAKIEALVNIGFDANLSWVDNFKRFSTLLSANRTRVDEVDYIPADLANWFSRQMVVLAKSGSDPAHEIRRGNFKRFGVNIDLIGQLYLFLNGEQVDNFDYSTISKKYQNYEYDFATMLFLRQYEEQIFENSLNRK